MIGDAPVRRPLAGLVIVRPSRELAADHDALRAITEASAELTTATHGQLVFRVSQAEDGDVLLHVRVDAGISSAGTEVQQLQGDVVVSGSIILRTAYHAGRRPIVVHEMLHWMGLPNHSSVVGDIMNPASEDPNRAVSAREVAVIRYLLDLQPGQHAACR